jgi:excinuclease ABC subunit C
MLEAARKHDFEGASEIKRRIEALTVVREKTLVYGPANELEELKRLLGLKKPPDVIEAFDVSNIMGSSAVGSMIYFHRGRPRKDEYRKFRIKTVERIDDYAMMREIVSRRYARLAEEKRTLPDLILIDGGKGHLNAALAELQRLGLGQIPAIGIAKEFEHIYIKGRDEPMVLPKESKALHLLQRIRDEAHRFAIAYHKNLLSKGVRFSELDNIRGIGPKRRRALLAHFGSVDGISRAGIEDLMKVEGMNEESARAIIGYFKR